MIRQIITPDPQSLAERLSAHVAKLLRHAIDKRGQASFVVSGGRTPKRLFEVLSHVDLPWEKISITLADERLVAKGHADHNAGLVRQSLLQNVAAKAKFFPLWDGQGDARQQAEQTLSHFADPFDVMLLGMGEDGHTASLFPHAPGLEQALDPHSNDPLFLLDETGNRQARISLSLSRILQSRHILLAYEGEVKQAVLAQALAGLDEKQMPIRALINHAPVMIELFRSETTQ